MHAYVLILTLQLNSELLFSEIGYVKVVLEGILIECSK